jgi:uncharacterized protein
MIRAVLDANVFLSATMNTASVPGRIIDRFLHQSFELIVTPGIIAEARRAMNYSRVKKRIAPGLDADEWLLDVMALAEIVTDRRENVMVSRDPDDDRYVAAALEGRADFIVSGDDDLLVLREYQGVLIVTPRVFLGLLGR